MIKKILTVGISTCLVMSAYGIREEDLTPFTRALRRGTAEEVRAQIAQGADVNQATNDHISPLCHAIAGNNEAAITVLLEAGADVNLLDANNFTPLICAAGIGNRVVIELLLNAHADMHGTDNQRKTPLMAAACFGRLDITALLIDRGARAADRDVRRWTALTHAAIGRSPGSVATTSMLIAPTLAVLRPEHHARHLARAIYTAYRRQRMEQAEVLAQAAQERGLLPAVTAIIEEQQNRGRAQRENQQP